MAEYIERESALYTILCEPTEEHYPSWYAAKIKALHTADVAPVKHGKWIEKTFLMGTSNFCSLCGCHYGMPHEKYNFCPNCGARCDL